MSIEPLNTQPLQQLIAMVKQADASRAKEVKIPIEQAKNIAFALGIAMARLNGDMEKFIKENSGSNEDIIVTMGSSSADWT